MVVEISAFSVHVHPLFDLMFVVSSIPRLHAAAYHLHAICILQIIDFPYGNGTLLKMADLMQMRLAQW